jgi:immunoglobulin superfamily protein 2/3
VPSSNQPALTTASCGSKQIRVFEPFELHCQNHGIRFAPFFLHPGDGKPPVWPSLFSPESSISVEVASNASVVLEGEDLHFSCTVRTVGRLQARFSVIWQLVDRQNRRSNVMWLDRDGTLQPGSAYWERSSYGGIQMEQVQPNSFSLGIFNSRKEDEGQYECHVTEWVRAVDGEWQIVGERRASTLVSITALGE